MRRWRRSGKSRFAPTAELGTDFLTKEQSSLCSFLFLWICAHELNAAGWWRSLRSLCHSFSVAPSGLAHFPLTTHGLRRGLHSSAASRLGLGRRLPLFQTRASYDTNSSGTRFHPREPTQDLRPGLIYAAASRLERREFPARMQVVHLVESSPRVRERITAFQHLNREDR